jgi:hypothetical protein
MVSGLNTHLNTHIEGCKVPILPVTVYSEIMFKCNPNIHQLQEGRLMKSIFSLSKYPWPFTFFFHAFLGRMQHLDRHCSTIDLSIE